ncbi:MAG: HAMP domain-containing protein [Firmicutes bacterium]|nr:HAMP domain-containing protein [Bacillota bacterium]
MKTKLSIRGKLLTVFAIIVLLIVAGNRYTFRLIRQLDDAHMVAIDQEHFSAFVAQREVDHLAWGQDLLASMLYSRDFQGELDPTACALGKWYYSYIESADFAALPNTMQKLLKDLERPHKNLHEGAAGLVSFMQTQATTAELFRYFEDNVGPHLTEARGIMAQLRLGASELGQQAVLEAEAVGDRTYKTLMLAMVAVAILSIGLIVFVTAGITRVLEQVVSLARRIGDGDLSGSLQVSSGDECETMATAINQFVDHVRDIVRNVRSSVMSINNTSHQVARAMDEMSAATQDVATTASEFATHVQQVSFDASEMAEQAQGIAVTGHEGSQQLDDLLKTMDRIEAVVGELAEAVQDLNLETVEIETITATIADIADQINLLALNAAIEAARAGEQGRGFAVVAEEIRDLAERSSQASGEIELLISRVAARSDATLASMGQGSEAVNEGVVAVEGTAQRLGAIITSVEQMSERIQAIAHAAEGLAAGSQEIAAATEEQSATVDEISNSSQMLAVTADTLDTAVRGIKTGDEEGA